jgi:hypothetical protein
VLDSVETNDNTTCTLQDGKDGTGTAAIAGGALSIDAPTLGVGYGQFNVKCATLNFAGAFYTAIAGNTGSPGTSDLLNVGTGIINLQNSSLIVNVNGAPVGGNTWNIINASNIVNNFATKTSSPQTSLNYSPNQPNPGKYLVSF